MYVDYGYKYLKLTEITRFGCEYYYYSSTVVYELAPPVLVLYCCTCRR